MIKKIIAFMMIAIIFTGCGQSAATTLDEEAFPLSAEQEAKREDNMRVEETLNDLDYKGIITSRYEDTLFFSYTEKNEISYCEDNEEPITLESLNLSLTPVSEELNTKIQELGIDISKFINESCDVNWRFSPVKVLQGTLPKEIQGMYIISEKVLVLSDVNLTKDNLATIVHELIHYLTDINQIDVHFREYSGTKFLGAYICEGITEYLTQRYMKEVLGIDALQLNAEEPDSHNIYDTMVLNIQAFDVTFDTNLVKSYLHGKPGELREAMAKKCNGDLAAYSYWLNCIDEAVRNDYNRNPNTYYIMGTLFELYHTISNSQKDKQLIRLENEYYLRRFSIRVNLKNQSNATVSWFTIHKMAAPAAD